MRADEAVASRLIIAGGDAAAVRGLGKFVVRLKVSRASSQLSRRFSPRPGRRGMSKRSLAPNMAWTLTGFEPNVP
eukprot:scaffold105528_cov69-Phaeocystis_antarctica.AAC.4